MYALVGSQAFHTGASSELFVGAYYASNGYTVLFPFLTQSRYDIAVEKDGEFQKVQVKTATWNRASPPYAYLQARVRCRGGQGNYEPGDWDVLAATADGMLWLFPWETVGHLSSLCLTNDNPNPKPMVKSYDPDAHRVM